MRNIEYNFISDELIGCFLELDNVQYWAVYFPDDGQKKIIFSANKSSIQHMEDFTGTSIEKIIEVINKYGCELEPEDEYGEVLYFNSIPKNALIYLRGYSKKVTYELKII